MASFTTSSISEYPVVLAIVFVVCATVLSLRRWWDEAPPYPPGPKGHPVIGNLLDIPESYQTRVWAKWAKLYGDVTFLNLLGTPVLIINSHKAAVELLDKRSINSSTRPTMAMAELCGWHRSLGMSPYNSRLREMRKHFHTYIGGRNVRVLESVEHKEILRFLTRLLNDPNNFVEHARWLLGDIIMLLAYGYNVQDTHDPYIEAIERVMKEFSHALEPGIWAVDFLPALKYLPSWLPGASFKRIAAKYKKSGQNVINGPYMMSKGLMENGKASNNFVGSMLESYDDPTPEQEDIIMWAATNFYGGGFETTLAAITSFFLAMALYPDVQRKAQQEIDRLIEEDGQHFPSVESRPKLPYVNALIKEILRWATVTPTTLPHATSQDDIYDGYRIPKGCNIIVNIWGILNDPDIFSAPEVFRPERFLDEDDILDPYNTTFGYGRRVCPGASLADQTLYLTVVSTLATFKITPIQGQEPTPEFTDGSFGHPKPFQVNIEPRTPEAESFARRGIW